MLWAAPYLDVSYNKHGQRGKSISNPICYAFFHESINLDIGLICCHPNWATIYILIIKSKINI